MVTAETAVVLPVLLLVLAGAVAAVTIPLSRPADRCPRGCTAQDRVARADSTRSVSPVTIDSPLTTR